MTDLTELTIDQMHDGLLKKDFSSVELTKEHIKKIKSKNDDLNAFVLLTEDLALERAAKADLRIQDKKNINKLTGIPYAAKDLYCTNGVRTTACSKALHDFVPNYESTITQRLLDAGAVMLGKTNMDEFAMGSANTHSYFGPVKNPIKRKDGKSTVPGGSSGGSAAAVAAGFAPFALGSDTGGSVRQPSSFCGLVGIRPTYGRCSRWGMIAFASSFDQAGIFAHNASDNATVLEVISGYDNKDSTCSNLPSFCYNANTNLKGLKVGIPKECKLDGLDSQVQNSWDLCAQKLEKLGAEILQISLPNIEHALSVYYVICCAEVSSNLARYDGIRYGSNKKIKAKDIEDMYLQYRSWAFGQEAQRRIFAGTYVLSAGHYGECYAKAQGVKKLIAHDYAKAFSDVDIILNPTSPTEAFLIDDNPDPMQMYINDIFTVPSSVARLPCVSVPFGTSANGLPLGMHLTSNYFEEGRLLDVATALQNKD